MPLAVCPTGDYGRILDHVQRTEVTLKAISNALDLSRTPSSSLPPLSLDLNTSSPTPVTPSPRTTLPPATASAIPPPTPTIDDDNDQLVQIQVAHDRTLTVMVSAIPDPPNISYHKDIDKLSRIWDDTLPFWTPDETPFSIAVPFSAVNEKIHVALIYWPQIYMKGRPQHWDHAKKSWSEWKFVMERYRASTPTHFWSEFSDDTGKRLPFSKIATLLREERKLADEQLVAQAQSEFGEQFSSTFSYRLGGQRGILMQRPHAIAKVYRSMHESL